MPTRGDRARRGRRGSVAGGSPSSCLAHRPALRARIDGTTRRAVAACWPRQRYRSCRQDPRSAAVTASDQSRWPIEERNSYGTTRIAPSGDTAGARSGQGCRRSVRPPLCGPMGAYPDRRTAPGSGARGWHDRAREVHSPLWRGVGGVRRADTFLRVRHELGDSVEQRVGLVAAQEQGWVAVPGREPDIGQARHRPVQRNRRVAQPGEVTKPAQTAGVAAARRAERLVVCQVHHCRHGQLRAGVGQVQAGTRAPGVSRLLRAD